LAYIPDCPEFMKLVRERKYKELSSKPRCGFEGKDPKLCCPPVKKKAIAGPKPTPVNIDTKSGDTNSSSIENNDSSEEILFELQGGDNCGVRETPAGFRPFIFGGTDADAHEYPWAAALEYQAPDRLTILCTGTLITRLHVLTAAHCLLEVPLEVASVRLGHADLSDEGSFRFLVEKSTPHPDYKKGDPNILNDIAILHLERPVRLTNTIRPVCLPTPKTSAEKQAEVEDTNLESKSLTVIGWGRTESVARPDKLQELELKLVDRNECQSAYLRAGADSKNFQISPRQMCADGDFGSDSCKGDSGGPLLFGGGNDRRSEIIGVVSFGTNKCDSSVPGILTRVSTYVDWIKTIIVTDRDKLNTKEDS